MVLLMLLMVLMLLGLLGLQVQGLLAFTGRWLGARTQ